MATNSPGSWSRRAAVKAGLAAAAAGSAMVLWGELQQGSPLADSYAALRIGERFADQFPDTDALWRGERPRDERLWGERLQTLLTEDYHQDRLLEVDGWWLAETEVRLAVLVYLAQQ